MCKKVSYFFFFCLLLVTFSSYTITCASEKEDRNSTTKKFDMFGHVGDAHDWHFATIGHTHLTFPLPIILYKKGSGWCVFSSSRFYDELHHRTCSYKGFKLHQGKIKALDGSVVYDFSITKNVVALLLSLLLLLLIFGNLRHYCLKLPNYQPQGFAVVLLYFIHFIRRIAQEHIGEKDGKQFVPYLLTLFFFIWGNNILSLMPEGANTMGNIAVAASLGISSFVLINWNASKGYWRHIFAPPGVPIILYPILIPIELISLFVKPLTLMMRLFANILAGHMVLLTIISLTFILKKLAAALLISLPLGILALFLELFTAFLQAYIFTLLTAMYVGMAKEAH